MSASCSLENVKTYLLPQVYEKDPYLRHQKTKIFGLGVASGGFAIAALISITTPLFHKYSYAANSAFQIIFLVLIVISAICLAFLLNIDVKPQENKPEEGSPLIT